MVLNKTIFMKQHTDYNGTPLGKKLGVKPLFRIKTRNAPENYMEILEPLPDGVVHLRNALVAGEKEEEEITITTHYVGAPRYEIWVKAPDYKVAEEELKTSADKIISSITEAGGTGEFQRKRE